MEINDAGRNNEINITRSYQEYEPVYNKKGTHLSIRPESRHWHAYPQKHKESASHNGTQPSLPVPEDLKTASFRFRTELKTALYYNILILLTYTIILA